MASLCCLRTLLPNINSQTSLLILKSLIRTQYSLEEIMATARAAEASRSPAMILLFPWALKQFKSHLVKFCSRRLQICSSANIIAFGPLSRS
jgi:hypothetical protein